MTSFKDDLTVTQLSGGAGNWRLWRLASDLTYDMGNGKEIVVPTGFITDGPSIPQIFWNILPVWGSWARAGVVHDFICCLLAMKRPHELAPDRKACDRVFLMIMVDLGVDWLQFSILYLGVCCGRWFNVRTTMVDYNVKLSAILDARAQEVSAKALEAAKASPVGGDTALPLIQEDHPHTFEALNAVPNGRAVVEDPVKVAKQQAVISTSGT
jgi:Protein of unknown function (DUF1353)